MDIDQWKLFVQVAQTGSLTRTAALRNTAQPVISRQIGALERACGGPLFDRTGRGVGLNDAGRRILPRVLAWLDEAEQLAGDLRGAAGGPAGLVRVGMLPSTGHLLAGTLFERVRKRYPGIQLRIVEAVSDQMSDMLRTGLLDVAVLHRYGRDAVAGDVRLALVDLFLVGPPGDALTRAPTVAFSRLAGLPLVVPAEPNALRRTLHQMAQRKRIALSVVMECESLALQKAVVGQGSGYALLGSHALVDQVRAGRLQAARVVSPALVRSMTLAVSKYRPPTPAVTEVARLVRECAAETAVGLGWRT